MNILKEADKIINERSEEKTRQYGPFSEGMERAAKIASGMTGKEFTAQDVFKILIALKLSRESYFHKEDNLLDCAAYIGALNNFEEELKFSHLANSEPLETEDLKQKLEDEVFPELKPQPFSEELLSTLTLYEMMLQQNAKTKEYVKYLAENIDKTIDYSEYLANELNNLKDKLEKRPGFIDVGDAGPG
jgi:hypothetical protein